MSKKDRNNGFSERLSTLIKEKKLTLAQVAAATGTSTPSVHRWTKGGEIDYENLRLLADFLEVNWIWLRYGDEAINNVQESPSEQNSMIDMRRKYLSEIMESEARMKTALEMAQVVCWEWNVLSGELSFSENAVNVFGCDPEKLRSQLLPFENLPVENLGKYFTENQPYIWDFDLVMDGVHESKWFSSRGTLLKDSMDRPLKLLAISADITERKKTEQALEFSELMMRKMIEIIPVGLCGADNSGRICLLNPEQKKIWGGEKFVGLEDYGVYKGWRISGEELGAEGWALARAFKYGESQEKEEINIESFDGKKKTILMYAEPLLDKKNQVIGAIEVNQDITEIKNISEYHHHTPLNWDSIFEQDRLGVVYFENNGQIKQSNKKFAAMIGLDDENISEHSLDKFFDRNTFDKINKLIDTATKMANAEMFEGRLNKYKNHARSSELVEVQITLFIEKQENSTPKLLILISAREAFIQT